MFLDLKLQHLLLANGEVGVRGGGGGTLNGNGTDLKKMSYGIVK